MQEIFYVKRPKGTLETQKRMRRKIPSICLFDFEERIISDCNAMNYTQIAFEINFYFSKFNMLWILRVTSDMEINPFLSTLVLFVWGCAANIANNSQYTNGRKILVFRVGK